MKSLCFLGVVYFFYGMPYIIYMVFFTAYLVNEMGYSQAGEAFGPWWAGCNSHGGWP